MTPAVLPKPRRGLSRRFSSSGNFATERIPKCGSFPNVMAMRFEDQPWHQEWREALDRVIAAQMRRDGAKLGTPERAPTENTMPRLSSFARWRRKSDHGPQRNSAPPQ